MGSASRAEALPGRGMGPGAVPWAGMPARHQPYGSSMSNHQSSPYGQVGALEAKQAMGKLRTSKTCRKWIACWRKPNSLEP